MAPKKSHLKKTRKASAVEFTEYEQLHAASSVPFVIKRGLFSLAPRTSHLYGTEAIIQQLERWGYTFTRPEKPSYSKVYGFKDLGLQFRQTFDAPFLEAISPDGKELQLDEETLYFLLEREAKHRPLIGEIPFKARRFLHDPWSLPAGRYARFGIHPGASVCLFIQEGRTAYLQTRSRDCLIWGHQPGGKMPVTPYFDCPTVAVCLYDPETGKVIGFVDLLYFMGRDMSTWRYLTRLVNLDSIPGIGGDHVIYPEIIKNPSEDPNEFGSAFMDLEEPYYRRSGLWIHEKIAVPRVLLTPEKEIVTVSGKPRRYRIYRKDGIHETIKPPRGLVFGDIKCRKDQFPPRDFEIISEHPFQPEFTRIGHFHDYFLTRRFSVEHPQ